MGVLSVPEGRDELSRVTGAARSSCPMAGLMWRRIGGMGRAPSRFGARALEQILPDPMTDIAW